MRSDGSGDGAGKAVLPPPSWPRPPRHKVARLTLSFRHAMREKLYAREAALYAAVASALAARSGGEGEQGPASAHLAEPSPCTDGTPMVGDVMAGTAAVDADTAAVAALAAAGVRSAYGEDERLSHEEVTWVVSHAWEHRCAVSGTRIGESSQVLALTVWDHARPHGPDNVVLLRLREANAHDEHEIRRARARAAVALAAAAATWEDVAAGDELDALLGPGDYLDPATVARIERVLATARTSGALWCP